MTEQENHLNKYIYLLTGGGLIALCLLAMDRLTTIWLFDPQQRPDLYRALALDTATSSMIMEAAFPELIIVFLALILAIVTGICLPLFYYVNRRFEFGNSSFLVVLRQSMWVGGWATFCVWLQMLRALTIAVAILVLGVLFLFELLLQVRGRAALETQSITAEP